ncbi:MAG: aminopeptidase P N-terminal domain-containing protein [Myxococcales bacterium]|nr:aminopeptidase P N-terminal domain-containing protein [Myxococcales bacterium]
MFAERRQRVREAMGPGAVAILLGAPRVTRSRDTDYPFRQDSDFTYLTGFDHPNAIAVLRTDGGPEYTLYVEPRNREAETWTGYRPGVDGARRDHEADEAHPNDEFRKHLPDLVRRAKRLYHVLGRDPAVDAKLTEVLEDLRLRSRQGHEPAEAIVDPRGIVHEMRLFKEPAELDVMRRAAAITRDGHEAAARLARDAVYEYELQAVIEYTFRRRGAHGAAYTTIVGGGRNATILHYIANDQKLNDGELVLIDAGCELEGYASDVTRTYPVGGRFAGPGRAIYEVVLAAQQAALEACRPGGTLSAIHDAAVLKIVAGLVDLGLLRGNVEDLIASEAHRPFYMHNTSHWLGLDVHDVGLYRLDGEARALRRGMVFTVEPGIYVAADDETVDPRFRGIGVRIEDDVTITADGYENLTAAIPKAPDELAALVGDA